MIICHCNMVTQDQIVAAIKSLQEKGEEISVGSVLREIGVRFKCGGCLGSYVRIIKLVNDLNT